jgi:hypothetical protein
METRHTTLQVSPATHALFKAACERHPMNLPMTAALNGLLRWFAAQDQPIQTAIIANVDKGMEGAYADALESLAKELRSKAMKSLEAAEQARELNLAAGQWIKVIDTPPEASNPPDQSNDRFYLRISGRAMEPDWRNGSNIEFRTTNVSNLAPGDDIYVLRRDGTATFKRIVAVGKNRLRLAAINRQVARNELHVRLNEIARIAVAKAITPTSR